MTRSAHYFFFWHKMLKQQDPDPHQSSFFRNIQAKTALRIDGNRKTQMPDFPVTQKQICH